MGAHHREGVRRLSLTLSNSIFNELETAKIEQSDSYVGIVSAALEHWFEYRRAERMRAGYLAMNDSNNALLDEFSEVDRENW